MIFCEYAALTAKIKISAAKIVLLHRLAIKAVLPDFFTSSLLFVRTKSICLVILLRRFSSAAKTSLPVDQWSYFAGL